jgi:dihydrodipicolinate synthase/N-acetylneuraminate lyase
MTIKQTACPDELRDALNSPVPSIRTPFTADGQIDFDGVRAQVDFLIAGKAKTLMLTWGDSLHSVLTDDEVAELAWVVVEHNRGRAKVIAADNSWATPKAVAYAQYCKQIGADLLMLLPPDWGASTTPDTLVDHFNAVGQHMPTMMVTAFFTMSGPRPLAGQLEVIRQLYERAPNQVAVKDDILGELGTNLCLMTHERWAVVSGGLMSNHTLQVPYGVDGYLCLLMSYKPEIAWQYFNAVQANDFQTAWRIIREIEKPLMKLLGRAEGGFNAAVHGMSELFGISGRHLPPPYHTMTDAEMEELADGLKGMGLL